MSNNLLLHSKLKNHYFQWLLGLLLVGIFNSGFSQCNNYQVYESIGTALPTSGGTWTANAITYSTGTARTGNNLLLFDAAGDYIQTPQIPNPGVFSFWYARNTNTTAHSFDIQTSPDNITWTSRGTTTTPTTAYQQFSIDLGALSLTNVYVRILDTRASGADSRYVDDITWTSTVTANNTFIPAMASCSQSVVCGTTYSFSDEGGINDTYKASKNYIITFTPSVGTNKIQLVFSAFNTENKDGMVIYNGPNTASPIISSGLPVGGNTTNCPAGSYYGTTSPGTITSTDATGAITIQFRSDLALNNAGWLASVTCVPPPAACVAPSSQASGFALGTTTSTSLASSFIGSANGYLVIRSLTSTPPTQPVDGTIYSSANIATLGAGLTFIQSGSSTTITDTGLAGNTQYYYFIYAYNNLTCSGGPAYNTAGPLTGNGITCPAVPNSVATASVTSSGFTLNWATPTGGSASALTYTVQVTTDSGYTANIAGSPFSIAAPTVTKVLTGLTAGTTYYYRILASNACSSSYVTGSVLVPLANDDCSGAIALTVNPALTCTTSTSGTTVGATQSLTGCAGTADDDVWYSFTATTTSHILTATPGTLSDLVFEVYSGSCASLSSMTCVNTTTGSTAESTTITGLTAGNTYYVRVYSFASASNQGTFSLCITTQPACVAPASQASAYISGAITSSSIAASFSGTADSYLIIRSLSSTPPSQPVAGIIYSAANIATLGAGLTFVQSGISKSITETGLAGNTQYYYFIYAYNNTSCSGGPTYNTAGPLTGNGITCPAVPNTVATASVNSSGFTLNWTAPTGGSASAITYTVQVTTDSGYTTNVLGSPFTIAAPTVTKVLTGLAASTTYYYRILASNACSSAYVTGSVTTTALTSTNDLCSANISLTVNPSSTCASSTTGTTVAATQSQAGCFGTADDDVWYTFVATGTSHIVTVTPITLSDAVFQVFSGSCASLSSIVCVDNTSGSSIETTNLTGLTIGNTYFVRVYSYSSGSNQGTFSICITTPVPPINNQCANAINLPCGTSNLAGSTVLANSYPHGTGCLMSNYGVWYKFTGDGNSSTISVTTTSNDIELSISSGSCGSLTNIACQDSSLSSGTETYTFTTAVGVNYYVYIANWYSGGTSTDTGTFTISRTCVVPYNPCTSIPNISACGSATSVTIPAGTGGYSPSSCGWTTPGVEQIYTFTPATTGNFTITQSNSFAYINYQFKPASSGCSSVGWSCIGEMSGATTSSSFTLTAGVQYYILLDPESSSGGSVNFTINCPIPPLTNDEPCNAISLTVNTSCSYSSYTNSGAAASGGVTDPGCGGYSGGDVWFSAVVPATGVLNVDLQAGVMTDSGMAFYSGTCGSLTLLECDDDDSANGSMSYISMVGLTPGQTIYIRVWEYGNNNNGTFGICATTPSCPPPSDLYATIISATSATVNWNNTTPPSSNGYQYYITTTNTPPTSSSTPTGSTAAGVNGVTLTGLTSGQDYYFWVRAYCGGSDYSTWFGPTNYSPCAVGNGTGTTTLSCPSVVAGGQGLGGADPASVSCSSSTCTNLEATYLQLNQATDYTVSSIPYAPPYQYTCLQNPVSVNTDDKWSPIINLPFNFCFYGNNYNKCLIGSNGVITFDTTNNTPGGYSAWSFNTDLPSTSLFKNSIFGVYHDIDPGVGGEVGWELITLNTGCRALVASWDNIPMFSSTCNSILYTGMIVLYENTNVIDVYIKQKSVCSTWNNGNAIVGVQNSTGTAAVVPPNRNGLSSDWSTTNEAWRFTPSGPSLTSIKWYEGSGTTGAVVGTTNTVNVCPSATTVYTAEVTYALCSGTDLKYTDNVLVTVTGTKIWNGSQSSDWNTSNNWTPSGVPTSANCVVIPVTANNPVISNTPNAVGYNLFIYNNAQLTMNASQNLILTDKITVQPNATFTVNNNANLVQINDTAVNTGSINYKRIAPNIKGSDYVYWSSPVANQNMGSIYDGTFPYSSGYKYQWNPTLNNNNGAGGNTSQGLWETASGIMTMGRGYIIRGSSSFGMPASNIPSTFTGVPFNGIIPYTVQRGSYTGAPYNGANGVQITNLNDNYNLLGNPYPSSINALKFLQTNAYDATTNPSGKILGNVKLWTHGTDPLQGVTNPFYGSYQYNYDANDYLTINYLGSTTPGSADLIRSGQAFFVQMIDGAAGSGTVNFNNSMRYDATYTPYSNSGFFKNASIVNNEISLERHRLWLDLVDSNSQSSGILVGYATEATNDFDNLFDAPTAIPGGMKLFSTITNNTSVFEIQGRGLPFDINDEIPIGINVPAQGNYSFAIAALDGLFENQNIYLKDTMLNVTHDLKANPYLFTTVSGVTNDRFKIVYIDNTLGTTHTINANSILVITNNEVAVSSNNLQMESVVVYNVLGQKLNTYDNVNSNYVILSGLRKNNTTLFLKIKLQTGETVTKKISY